MATMVCRGLHSHLESPFIETSYTLMAQMKPLQFAFESCFALDSKPLEIAPPEQCDAREILCNSSPAAAGLSFLQALDGAVEPSAAMAIEKPDAEYVHPFFKRSRSALSDESLAVCTEDLGNETGADFAAAGAWTDPTPETRKRVKSATVSGGKRGNRREREFPPPLTTISGCDSIMVRSHREDGRLIINAVENPARHYGFHVDRSHGRLRLSISIRNNSKEEEEEEEEEEERNDDVTEMEEEESRNIGEDLGGKVAENEYTSVVGAEAEIEKIERGCRCKEGENIENTNSKGRILNWEPVWVATS